MVGVLDGPDKKPVLFVGDDKDDEKAQEKGFAVLCCCKDGPHSHRQMLGYTSLGAPRNKDYYFIERGKRMALNLIDADDPSFIPEEVVNAGLKFIDKQLQAGNKVLVHCNAGHSRSTTLALLYLRSIGEMPYGFRGAEKVFRSMYPNYDPGEGMRHYARAHWNKVLKG
jgi:hypothetical protein